MIWILIFLNSHLQPVEFPDEAHCRAARMAVLEVSTIKSICVEKGVKIAKTS